MCLVFLISISKSDQLSLPVVHTNIHTGVIQGEFFNGIAQRLELRLIDREHTRKYL